MSKAVLKPCPFCGSTKIKIWSKENDCPWVQCQSCLASTSAEINTKDAIAAWNRRAKNE